MKISLLLFAFFAAQVIGHSYFTNPISRSNQRESNTGCRGPACLGPCDRTVSGITRAPIPTQRGATLTLQWPRNNHAGGFIRLAWARTGESDSHAAFDSGVQQINCHEVGGCGPDNAADPNGGDSGPSDGSSRACTSIIQVPNHLTDGTWTLQWSWFGGAFALGDYYSCADYIVNGGNPVTSQLSPVFIGGDWTYPGQQKCKYFNTDRLHQCINEPCNNPVYPAGERSGPPYSVASPPPSVVTTSSVTTSRAPITSGRINLTTGSVTSSVITSSKVTSSPVTTNPVTSGRVTSSSITSGRINLTTNVITSSQVTSSALTTSPVTSSPVTSSPVTSSPVTTSPLTTSRANPVTTARVSPVTTGFVTSASRTTASLTTSRVVPLTTGRVQSLTTSSVNPSNCASLSQLSISSPQITYVSAWSTGVQFQVKIVVQESILSDWYLLVTWPEAITASQIEGVYDSGRLKCIATDNSHIVIEPAGEWIKNLPQGRQIYLEIELSVGGYTESYVRQNVDLKFYTA